MMHIGTHDKEASKRFRCETCARRFSRKHDLSRHRETIHGERMPSSASSASRHRFEPDLSQYPTTIVGGDERLMSSLHPGPFADPGTGLEDLVESMRLGYRGA
jgi:hypothetical protein